MGAASPVRCPLVRDAAGLLRWSVQRIRTVRSISVQWVHRLCSGCIVFSGASGCMRFRIVSASEVCSVVQREVDASVFYDV